jgi:uncharacterized repeat protein (TIGR01451 family)
MPLRRALTTVLLGAVLAAAWTAGARAVPATGGVGRFGGAIDWVSWGAPGAALNLSGPVTRDSTTTFAGRTLIVRCTISNFVRTGGGTPALRAYRPGSWGGDALDELYDIGGTGASNQLVNGLATTAMEVSFDFTCSATLDGAAYPLDGIVFADAEQSGNAEFVAGRIPTTATWRLIDRYRTPGCTNDSQVTRTVSGANQTLQLDNPSNPLCGTGPAGVAFADGATAGRITVRGGGTSAVALGAVVTFDHGDAPASYGDALHALAYPFTGGIPRLGTSGLFAGNTLATTTQPANTIGASADPEGTVFSPNADGDDKNPNGAFGPGDDETQAPPGQIVVDRGDTVGQTVACRGTGVLAGWIDFNGNGTFDPTERAGAVPCAAGSATLSWTVPPDTVDQARSFLRLRYAANPAEIADPTGLALSGEVEDHAFVLSMPPDLTISKSVPTPVEPGSRVSWTLIVRNVGNGPSGPSTVTDSIPAGIANAGSPTPGCSVSGGTVTCSVDALPPGGSTQLTVTGDAPPTPGTCFTNTATVTVSGDRDTSNDTATATACTRPPRADVRIAKAASATTVRQDDQVRYTLTVSNAGPDSAATVHVADAPGSGVSPLAATPSQGTCASASACDLGTLGPGQTATIEIVARAAELGTQGNTATVTTATIDADPSNDAASTSIVVEPQADVRLVKAASATALTEGDDFSYTIDVTNAGPSTAADAVVTDSIPPDVRVRSVSASRGACTQDDPIVCRLGDLADGGSATITIRATATAPGSPVNTAIASSPTPDPVPANNQDATRLTTAARADLSIRKDASAASVLVGESFGYTLTVRNDGPSAAVNTVVTDRIPDGLQLDVATSSKGTCAGAPTVVCELGTLARGQEATIRLTVTARAAGVRTNTASVTSETPDPDPADNLGDALVEAGTRADLSIAKTVDAKTVVAGGRVVYGLVVTNHGPLGAADVTVTDPVPDGVRVISATPSTGSCTVTTRRAVVCDLGDLADGMSATIRIEAVAGDAGSTRDVASVTSPTPDPDPRDNQAETEVTSEKADVRIVKTPSAATVALGGTAHYRIVVSNAGPSPARGVVVTDPIPAGLLVEEVASPPGACGVAEGAVVCRIGDLAPGQSLTIGVAARGHREGRVRNAASATATFPSDPDLSNNAGGAEITVMPGRARLAVAKTAGRRQVPAGGRVSYRIVVRNRSARTARRVQVCDRVPAGLAVFRHPGARLRHGRVCWSHVTLPPRTARTFRLTARVLRGASSRLVNTARVTASNAAGVHDSAAIRRLGGATLGGGVTG